METEEPNRQTHQIIRNNLKSDQRKTFQEVTLDAHHEFLKVEIVPTLNKVSSLVPKLKRYYNLIEVSFIFSNDTNWRYLYVEQKQKMIYHMIVEAKVLSSAVDLLCSPLM